MARFNLLTPLTLLTLALFSPFTTPTPLADTSAMTPNLVPRQSFIYRFYTTGTCDHSVDPSSTSPPADTDPWTGNTGGTCYNAPDWRNHDRLEINIALSGVITFCNVNCQGSGSVHQSGTNCYVPPPNCAIGSFKVV